MYLKTFIFYYITILLSVRCGCSLICPGNITSFSIGPYDNQYYACEDEGRTPILRNCPANEFYWPVKGKCSTMSSRNAGSRDGNSDLHTFSTHVLGNPVYLGCLYDATKHEIMAADSFWDRDTILKHKVVSPSYSQNIQFFAASTTFDRLNHMKVELSLKLEFLGGLLTVEGSAAFLRDSLETENTVAFILDAHYTTRTEMLPIATPLDHIKLCSLKGPTHVVTAITYGMDANFVFKKTARKGTRKQEVEGSLKIAVKSIPGLKIEGGGKVKISETLRKMIDNIEVKLYGDFVLDEQPTTYNESVKVFKELSSHLGKKPEYRNAAKMKMQLTPITRFCDAKTTILIGISDNLVQTVAIMLDEIERTKLEAKTLLTSDSVNNYLPLKKILTTFINKLSLFDLAMKRELQTLLPNIRGGGASSSESDLVAMLTTYRKSPFYFHTSQNFLQVRKREIEMIDFILEPSKFKGTEVTVLDFEKATDGKILFTKPYVTMVRYNILPSLDILDRFLQGKTVDESNSWFNNKEVLGTMGQQFRAFMQFSNANRNIVNKGFLLALTNANSTFMNVFAQRKGKILSSNFDFPSSPPQMFAFSNMFNAIYFPVDKPKNIWVTGFTIRYWEVSQQESVTELFFEFGSANATNAEISGLTPNGFYQFNMRYETIMGHSVSSPNTDPIVTRPCSPPTNVKTMNVTSETFGLQWDVPLHIGIGVSIVSYEVTIRGNDFTKKFELDSNRRSLFIKEAPPGSLFTVTIVALVNPPSFNESRHPKGLSTSSRPTQIIVASAPNPPAAPDMVAVSLHSATIKWEAPVKIADGAIIKNYLVKHVVMDNLGKEEYTGTDIVHSAGNKTSINLKDLAQGTTYGVTVKVVTSLGDSVYSSTLIIKTKLNQTELALLQSKITSISQEDRERLKQMNTQLSGLTRRVTKNHNGIEAILDIPTLKAHYYPDVETGCGGSYHNKDIMIRYPNHGNYTHGLDCDWNINTGVPTTLKITMMDLESCCDYVALYDNGRKVAHLTGHKFATINSERGILRVLFHTDGSVAYHGFALEITRDQKEAKRYYPEIGATFIKYGTPTTYASSYVRHVSTIPDCLKVCHAKYSIDNTWHGVVFDYNDDSQYICTCYQNDGGRNDFYSRRLYFSFT